MRTRCARGASVADRLALHSVDAPSGCRIWLGTRNAFGHGRFRLDGRTMYAHRLSYELHVGPVPEGFQLDHLCRRPACIRPHHLQAVPARINVLRGTSPGARAQRTGACMRGHHYADHPPYEHGGRRYCRVCREIHRANYLARQASA